MKKNIYYWSPCLNQVGTVKATVNSVNSLLRYSNDYNVRVIDVFGEWHEYKKEFVKRYLCWLLTLNYLRKDFYRLIININIFYKIYDSCILFLSN